MSCRVYSLMQIVGHCYTCHIHLYGSNCREMYCKMYGFAFYFHWSAAEMFEREEVDIFCNNIGERYVCFRFTYIKMYLECKHSGIITEMWFHLVLCTGLWFYHMWTGMSLVFIILLFGFSYYSFYFASSY